MFCVLIFKTLGFRRSYNVDDFYDFGGGGGGEGVKNHGGMWLALSWSCRVGVGGCEFGFTVIDVSSSSLWGIHGEGRRERTVE